MAGLNRSRAVARQAEYAVGFCEVPEERSEWLDGADFKVHRPCQSSQRPSNSGVADHMVTGVVGERGAGRKVIGVDHQGRPVWLGEHDDGARFRHSPQFREDLRRCRHVLQGAVHSHSVDAVVLDRQRVSVAQPDLDTWPLPDTSLSFLHHRRVHVHANDRPRACDAGEPPAIEVRARPATDECRLTGEKVELGKDVLFVLPPVLHRRDVPHIGDRVRGFGRAEPCGGGHDQSQLHERG